MRNRTSDLRITHSDTLPLSHKDSTVSEVYYDVHMTRVLHTARISSVDSIMFVNGIRTKKSTEEKNEKNMVEQRSAESEGLRFDSSCTTSKNFFLSHARDKTKTIFLYFFTKLKTYPLSYSIKDQAHRPGLEIEVVHFKFGLFSGSYQSK